MTRFSDLLGHSNGTAEADDGSDALEGVDAPLPAEVSTGDVTAQLGPAVHDADPLPMAVDAPKSAETVGRDVFSELAVEQVAQAERIDATSARLRELGLHELPAVEDDFLPGH